MFFYVMYVAFIRRERVGEKQVCGSKYKEKEKVKTKVKVSLEQGTEAQRGVEV